MKIVTQYGQYPIEANEFFDFEQLDAFHQSDVLTTIYGADWMSVLIVDREKAWLHTLFPKAIGDTGYKDSEPFVGYAGPVANTNDPEFIAAAVEEYSSCCKELGVIAEVIRFNPMLHNSHRYNGLSTKLHLLPTKEIVVTKCLQNPVDQMHQFNEPCRRQTRAGLRELQVRVLDKKERLQEFTNFYKHSLERVGADVRWYFSDAFFERVGLSKHMQLYASMRGDQMMSACVVVTGPLAGYYFLAANSGENVRGANELLIFKVAMDLARQGIPWFVLGGGNSPDPSDPLLRFKKKFSPVIAQFNLGTMIHNEQVYHALCTQAVAWRPKIVMRNYFLKYRLVTHN